jgi:hypothetical protein
MKYPYLPEEKPDWKFIATTPGYKSLKAAYIKGKRSSCQWERRHAEEGFRLAISLAKRYSALSGKPIHEILNTWEKGHTYGSMSSYYSNLKYKSYLYKVPHKYKATKEVTRTKNRWAKWRKKHAARQRKKSL